MQLIVLVGFLTDCHLESNVAFLLRCRRGYEPRTSGESKQKQTSVTGSRPGQENVTKRAACPKNRSAWTNRKTADFIEKNYHVLGHLSYTSLFFNLSSSPPNDQLRMFYLQESIAPTSSPNKRRLRARSSKSSLVPFASRGKLKLFLRTGSPKNMIQLPNNSCSPYFLRWKYSVFIKIKVNLCLSFSCL